jgi:serine phosphatase RsbU (regulator of sigma subunit)/anti-sigma regulatory factor (Ser/Thr protein kinase)
MAGPYEKMQVLVIDDERLIRMTLSAKLRLVGYQAVAVGSVKEALDLLNKEGCGNFRAIITDILKGDMDGFVLRDIVRGLDPAMPIFFMTALDPEEGGGFLKKILSDANSYYLPKSVKVEVLLQRVQSIVASRRVEQFIERQIEESRQAMGLAAHVQRGMLPARARMDSESFYTTLWLPKDMVSGDLYETVPLADGSHLYVLGDVQGHGISAALAMAAVQSFIKQVTLREGGAGLGPHDIANQIHRFFRESLAGVLYMTALVCIHRPREGAVDWLSCGAPDLDVLDPDVPEALPVNPEKRGGLPIGMMEDTVYTVADVVHTPLSKKAVCVAHTDGVLDLARDADGLDQMPDAERLKIRDGLLLDARVEGAIPSAPYKFMAACEAAGYTNIADDVTELVFGPRWVTDGIFESAVPMHSRSIDEVAERMGAWCVEEGWGDDVSTRVQLVFEEKLMNLHDHGFDDRERWREVASVRLRAKGEFAELTVWDCGTQEPSIELATGRSELGFDLANQAFSGRGRGRLMVRDICDGIARNRYGTMNETIYYIPTGTGNQH